MAEQPEIIPFRMVSILAVGIVTLTVGTSRA